VVAANFTLALVNSETATKVVIDKTVRLIGKSLFLKRRRDLSAPPKLANAVTVATARYYAHPLNG
jgi:hypothetical protein